MASNFHNILGFLDIGVDFHQGLQVATGVPVPEFPFWELVCFHPFVLGPNQKPNVKINGVSSVVDGHTPMVLWPHLPLTPMNAFFPLDMLFGTQSCWLPRSTVLIDGEMSTCCVVSCISVNLDCWEWASLPSDLTLQYATVQTTPSLSDFLFGALRAAINAALSFGMHKLFKVLGDTRIGKKFLNAGDHLGVELARKGPGYKLAQRIGSRFTSELDGQLTKRGADGFAKSVGRRIMGEFLSRAGLSGEGVAEKGLEAFGFEPSRLLPHEIGGVVVNPDEQSYNPFGGFKGTSVLDDDVPLYGATHGGVQALTGAGEKGTAGSRI